jgi:glutamate dehydrogenase
MRPHAATTDQTASLPASVDGPTVDDIFRSFRETAETVVPWFLAEMPPVYFQDTPPAAQRQHLRAIIAAVASDQPLNFTHRSEDDRTWTMLRPGNRPGVLADLVASLPLDLSLRAAKIHSSRDGKLVLDTFEFGDQPPYDPHDPRQVEKLKATIAHAAKAAPGWKPAAIEAWFKGCTADFVLTLTPHRMVRQHDLFARVSGLDSIAVDLDPEADGVQSRITVAFGNARTRTMLERCARTLGRYGISINRAHLDVIKDPPHGTVTILAFVVQSHEGGPLDRDEPTWARLEAELLRIKWLDDHTLGLLARKPELETVKGKAIVAALEDQHAARLSYLLTGLDVAKAEAIVALGVLVHQALGPIAPFVHTRERIAAAMEEHLGVSGAIADLLARRFDPAGPLSDAEFAKEAARIRAEIERYAVTEPARTVLGKALEAVEATLRTNYFLPARFCLAFRIDPKFLANPKRPETPFGTFFVHGRGFDGFHNRFQDIARGGLRVIRTASESQWTREGERLFDEVYGLSWAQQLKNKDIPEGGAKCAILVHPGEDVTRCVKAFVDGLLDLITPDPAVRKLVIDRLGREEFIYLGPDENITPDHIEWIVERARVRKYGMPTAFMSSKPGAGINHKTYGVTSEGVNVFLERALLARGIDPRKRPFSVKLTGGPDGDVAGNMIRILDRDYGANARVVGIADGSGSGEDPDGLDHAELLRLFREGLPIASFDRARLGKRGRITSVDEPDGARLRNTLHNRVRSDAFIPGGGRPATINESNWRDFLVDGVPSSPIIVEGANLFLTPEARTALSGEGVLIMKDSSANKCGVICSSFEIDACMVLSDEEFLAIKDRYVEDVLVRLRALAREEADLLLAEGRRHPTVPLPELSVRMSKVMNAAAVAIAAALPEWPEASRKLAEALVEEHLPPTLVEVAGKRIRERIPATYLTWLKAKRLAANITYREGIDFFTGLGPAETAELARRYLEKDRENAALVESVEKSSLPGRDRVAELLRRAGTRGALGDLA